MSAIGNIQIVNFKFIWEIENFSSLTPKTVGTMISSPRYKNNDTEWNLNIYPYGETEKTSDFIALFLKSTIFHESQTNVEMEVSFHLSILNKLKQKVFTSSESSEYISIDTISNKKDLYLSEDKLMILCEIYINPKVDKKFITSEEKNIQMFDNFESLSLEERFTDLTIIVDNKKLFVHKSILSASSEVFRTMLKNDMKENNVSLMKITDTSYDVMKEVLRFIYCGRVENLEKLAISIIPVAKKYDLISLKLVCEDAVLKLINIESACKILDMVGTYYLSDLKSYVQNYIITNFKEVACTSGFRYLQIFKPELLADFFHKISQEYPIFRPIRPVSILSSGRRKNTNNNI